MMGARFPQLAVWLVGLLAAACSSGSPHTALNPNPETVELSVDAVRKLIPIGADYQTPTLELFAEQAVQRNTDDVVELRVLLPTFSTNSTAISEEERQINLEDAQVRADQLQAVCESLISAPLTCNTTIPDIQIRSDAQDLAKVAEYDSSVDGVYSLGGDQVIAMEIMANTPLEVALSSLYQQAKPFGGGSAGAAIQSRYMIAGYIGDNFAWDGLEFGSVDLAYGGIQTVTRGLAFGLENAIIEQHALQRGRLIRSLQAVQRAPLAKIGLGPDWRTGVLIEDETLITETKGYTSAFIIDQETYGSAASAQYRGSRASLSIRNVGLHILPEGGYGYDLESQRPSFNGSVDGSVPDLSGRNFDFLTRPQGSAPVLIAGDLLDYGRAEVRIPIGDAFAPGSVLERFKNLALATDKTTYVISLGESRLINEEVLLIAKALRGAGLEVKTAVLSSRTDMALLSSRLSRAGAVLITGEDQPLAADLVDELASLNLDQLNQAGTVLLFDNAAAATVGSWMTSEAAPADDTIAKEDQASPAYLASYPFVEAGLGLVPGASFEPRTFYDYRYGRQVSVVYQHADTVSFGLEREAAIEITSNGATVLGPSALVVIDGRFATLLEAGANDGIAANWLILDTFTTNESLTP